MRTFDSELPNEFAAGRALRRWDPRPLTRRADTINQSQWKRALDVGGAACLLLFFLPALLLIAAAVAFDGSGPVFFRQLRYGQSKKPFVLLKFRTMNVMEASGPFRQAVAGDERITRLGRFLRRTSLDELPQLWNVLRGDMSLVGPRPHAVYMDEQYAGLLPHYADRHLVRPGLTGFAQVAGYRGPTANRKAMAERLRRDRIYIRRWSLWLDVKILVLTPIRLLHPNAL